MLGVPANIAANLGGCNWPVEAAAVAIVDEDIAVATMKTTATKGDDEGEE